MIVKNFGIYPSSQSELPKVYTEEPNQEGLRKVVVKRSGQVPVIG